MSDAAPHKILFVQNLPTATTDAMLAMLFQQFPGYKETRMVNPLHHCPITTVGVARFIMGCLDVLGALNDAPDDALA